MIWYLDHSAIAVETNNHLLLFDLFGKTLQPPKGMGLAQGFVNPDELRDKDVVIFVSHEHPDHFDPRQYLTDARDGIRSMVQHKIVNVLGCTGKA